MDAERLLAAKNKFSRLLKEIFQFDCADLDFGIYRILALRRGALERFLDEDLLPQVERILTDGQGKGGDVHAETKRLEATLRDAGITDFSGSAKWRELNDRREASPDVTALAREVFSDLTTFFGRYYEDGDFLALPRNKGGTYAIPHDGSEVTLHWANSDQYYIKTSERHADYTAELPGMTGLEHPKLRFRLAAADADRDNNKTSEKRRYILREVDPIEMEGDTLVAWFEYRVPASAARAPQQKAICQQAEEAILAAVSPTWRLVLGRPASQNDKITQLGYQLYRYTKKNTADYFVHKALGAFLLRELDFFIKNEVVFLDDLEGQTAGQLDAALRKVRAIRAVGTKIVDWLDQLERLQRRLFLKKKFILRTEWLVSASHLPEGTRALVADNPAQRESWTSMYGSDPGGPLLGGVGRVDDGFVADTGLLGTKLRDQILSGFSDVSGRLSGHVLRGENFHALRLLARELAEKVRVTYIDPPYNTGGDGFMYRDAYQHSSWLAMMRDRLALGRALASRDGTITVSIDDAEVHRLKELLDVVYGQELAKLVWDRNRKNDAKFFSVGHEYMLIHAADLAYLRGLGTQFREPKEGVEEVRALFERLRCDHNDDWERVRVGLKEFFAKMANDDPRKPLARYTLVDQDGPYEKGNLNWPYPGGPKYEVIHPVTGKPCKTPASGWRLSTKARFDEEVAAGRIVFGPDETTTPRAKVCLFQSTTQVMTSVHYSYAQTAAQEFDAMFGRRVFDNPKNWRDLARVIRYLGDPDCWVLDYFAGSGSTAHAVLALNRADQGRRRFALVEMGQHGDEVLIPRLQKAAYAEEWQDGRPKSRAPVPVLVKVAYMESYDDSLENVVLRAPAGAGALFEGSAALKEDYTLRYMLDLEAKASMLDLPRFRKPWHYAIKVRSDAGEALLQAVRRPNPLGDLPPQGHAFVDLVETFNYLLGLRVERYDTYGQEGLLFVTGTDPSGLRTIVVWRDVDLWPNDKLEAKCRQAFESFKPKEFDVVYVNGDNHLPVIKVAEDRWKVNLIEETFHQLMFDTSDVE
jgi:adenine-specific DNA-methyltransferase